MKKNISFCVVLMLMVCLLASCGGDPHVHEYDLVTQKCSCGDINPLAVARVGADTRFLSLQEAVDFIKTRKSVSSSNIVYLIKNTSGEGVTADGIVGGIAFDFGNFTYELTGSKGFEFINTETELKGGRITISVSASVETLISTSGSDLKTTSSFTGSIDLGTGSKLTVAGGEVSITGASITEENAFVIETEANVTVPDVSVAAEINSHLDTEKSKQEIQITVPHSHSDDGGKVVLEATCTSEGLKVFTCTSCKQIVKTEKIDKLEHVTSHTDYKAATHTEEGNVEYWYCRGCEKYYSNSDCTNELKTIVIPVLDSHPVSHIWYQKETCTEQGHIDCYYCDICNRYYEDSSGLKEIPKSEVFIAATGHNLEKHEEAKNATCTEDGNVEYWYCSNCKKYFSDSSCTVEIPQSEVFIKALGHDWKIAENGNHYCSREGCTEHSGHVPVFESSGVLCNCDCHSAEGNTHYLYHCTVCNQDYVASGSETVTQDVGGGFSITFKKDKIVCANVCFEDMGDYGLVWLKETPGSASTSILVTQTCVVNEHLVGNASESVKRDDGKCVISYTDGVKNYDIKVYITVEGNLRYIEVEKVFTRYK